MAGQSKSESKDKELAKALRECQTLAAAGQFAAAIMHEINNPLEAIANLTFLTELAADDPDRVRMYIGMLDEQLGTVIRIANQTLSYYRPSGAHQTADLVSIAESALRVHQPKISAKQIRLLKRLKEEVSVIVHTGQILQVLSNLIANAVDALEENGRLYLRVRKGGGEVHITIADDGHGIPEEILSRVFDPFFTTKEERGTGLGLAISKAIIEEHKGRIRTRTSTRPGRTGTAFRISLPLGRSEAARSA